MRTGKPSKLAAVVITTALLISAPGPQVFIVAADFHHNNPGRFRKAQGASSNRSLNASKQNLDNLFDGARFRADIAAVRPWGDGKASGDPERSRERNERRFQELMHLREVMSTGRLENGRFDLSPFAFRSKDGENFLAQDAGLEGFLFTKKDLESRFGAEAFLHHIDDYFNYLDQILLPLAWTEPFRQRLQALRESGDTAAEKNAKLNDAIEAYVEALRREITKRDAARWARGARIYEIFPRAYNLRGRREPGPGNQASAPAEGEPTSFAELRAPAGESETPSVPASFAELRAPAGESETPSVPAFFADFGVEDLLKIKEMGFDTVWTMGIFPIGLRNRLGTAGGSPYSVQDYTALHEDLGTEEDFRQFVQRAHGAGLKVIIDFVPNHSSMDSRLLKEHPEYYVHREADPQYPNHPPKGYFNYDAESPAGKRRLWVHHGGYNSYGSLATWDDTAQLDYSKPETRNAMARSAASWVERFDVDGFRVDMAYQIVNSEFSRNWGTAVPKEEFLLQLAREIKSIKPSAALIAEAYANFQELSASGFDLIYSKSDESRPEGQTGWYDALLSQNPRQIRHAIRRASYLTQQKGGADGLRFVGNHDERSPQRAFASRLAAAALVTMLLPGAFLFYGSQEIGFDRAAPHEEKSLPFSVPVKVDWKGGDPAVREVFSFVFSEVRRLRKILGKAVAFPLEPQNDEAWVGCVLTPLRRNSAAVAVVANLTSGETNASVDRPEIGIRFHGRLKPGEFKILYSQSAV
ncbi:MAG: hypothetical protein HY611_09100 [Elusimicrobia bacterium]|nr:hypothetical protein [Elusimicrobiota bacterium]